MEDSIVEEDAEHHNIPLPARPNIEQALKIRTFLYINERK